MSRFLRHFLCVSEAKRKRCAHEAEYDAQRRELHEQQRVPLRRSGCGELELLKPQRPRSCAGEERGDGGGQQRPVLQPAHGEHLHGKGRGGERRPEQPRKARGYARYQHQPRRVLHAQQPPHAVGYCRAELHRHALAARAAAEEVRQPGGAHDEGHEPERYVLPVRVPDLEHHAHAVFAAHAVVLICPGHQRADDAEEGQKPGRMRVPDRAQIQQHAPEQGVDCADYDARRYGGGGQNQGLFHTFHLSKSKKADAPAHGMRRAQKSSAQCGSGLTAEGDLIPCVYFLRNLLPVFM